MRSINDLAELEKMVANCLECRAELNVCADNQSQKLEDLPPADAIRALDEATHMQTTASGI
jgi:hypothetical protein